MKQEFSTSPNVYEMTLEKSRVRVYSQQTAFGMVRVETDMIGKKRKSVSILLNNVNNTGEYVDPLEHLTVVAKESALLAEVNAIIGAAEAEAKSGAKVVDMSKEKAK